ncbi:MAG: tetratricopeptide repeat protein [Deltaproteobacteria bacterium]|nr:tetratricopeptide repeat protein [Deltaproteobacteria bacterium]
MTSSTSAPSPWLSNPVVDVVVGCGLAAVPLALLSDFAGVRVPSAALVVIAALALLVNGPHYAATCVRAFGMGARQRRLLLIASVVAVVVAVAAHALPQLLPWLFTAFLTWSPWHYATQNHGIGLVVLARNGAEATLGERRALKLVHVLAAVAAIVATHAGGREPLLVRAGIPPQVAAAVAVVVVVVAVIVTLGVLRGLRQRGAARRGLMMVAVLVSTSLVWFAVPAVLARTGSLVYAGGVVALLHGAQSLWLTHFAEGRGAFLQERAFDVVAWGGLVVAGGVVLFTLVPWVVSKGLGYDLIISLLIVQAVVNLHHFVVDAFVWKLREPAVRALFAGDERASARRESVSNLRAVALSVPAVMLFLLGVVDVAQLAGTRSDAPAALRDRIMVVNDSDSRAWLRQAQDATAVGDLDGAKADLGHAVALSPWNADAQRALARLHVVMGRDDEAWSRYQAMPAGLSADADASLLFAGVAERMGKLDDADVLARRALALLEGSGTVAEVDARRTLGAVLLKAGKTAEARTQLARGLDDAEAALGYDPLRKGQLLELGLALADADVALTQIDPALVLYERALAGAKKADRPALAFQALASRAGVLMKRGDHPQALGSFQQALRFADDVVTADPERVARAWLDYASLLAQSEAPMRVRFACGLKARGAAEQMSPGKTRDELLDFVTKATRYVEEVLTPDDAESVRKDVDAAAADSLLLSYPDKP